ncbi:amino-acid N-acetyltransferase [Solemya pervernicosa gill symbiont]|uniref:Amino-acid acetyltransferase n=2 Tax=Gammaproteobacteria incertae sedis TaxID=118884 RepID=A0A1T2L0C0_9GAMM|nr:amino-acid N-acetyltransferase [Candidatus Reidiella endopervernicosa]OOZ38553.1 amino-acid N-acetyltransferase [Solemya pervernicosa gill symbiont]QKQ27653.1 amino-acid N-acetyltransferase [Candidatus Reidiella endopervernicosa]
MTTDSNNFIDSFRSSSPYINAHRGKTFVILFGGEAVADATLPTLIHDIALLNSLGIRLVLVHGARPQIEQRLKARNAEIRYENGLRITDDDALECVKEAAGTLRMEIEALLSMGLANTPMAGARLRVASGNFVTARPLGIYNGIDYCHTGEVRRVDTDGLRQRLSDSSVVLLSPIGYSPTGEIFNITAEEIATSVAIELEADKLIILSEERTLRDSRRKPIQQLGPSAAHDLLGGRRKLPADTRTHLESAMLACRGGVKRTHIIERSLDGALLQELYTRDGVGTLITAENYEQTRPATIDDVGGILELIEPLEEEGVLVRRSRDRLETEIDHFSVVVRDSTIIGCAALYPYRKEGFGELACLATHPAYRNAGRGDELLLQIEQRARTMGLDKLFVLTTRTAHWFRERGFAHADIKALPLKRRGLYNYQRNSKIFIKELDDRGCQTYRTTQEQRQPRSAQE